MGVRPVGLIAPHPARKPHPANGMTAEVHVGDGAVMTIIDPTHDTGLEWVMRYGTPEPFRYSAASVLDSYAYLLSGEISTAEAVRRLRIIRQAHKALRSDTDTPSDPAPTR